MARSAGLSIKLSASGGLTYSGNQAAAEKWLPVLRERKAEIISFLAGNQPEPYPDYAKTMALQTGTDWRPPGNPFFIRSYILNASMNEVFYGYWRAVYLVGIGHNPESAIKSAVADILHEWESGKLSRPGPMLSRRAS